jgi:4-carboxymuconolactone decarboxylase
MSPVDSFMPNRAVILRDSRLYDLRAAREHMPRRHIGDLVMTNDANPGRKAFGHIAPALADLTDTVLFGDVWKRPGLSPRDRSLVTVAALVALYRTNELPSHLKRALANGVSRDELIELMTHLAFYSGWPTASSAVRIAERVFAEERASNQAQ